MKDEDIESMMELSPLQQGMLFHTLYAPGSGVYVVQWSVRLDGRIDASLFQRAWQHVVDRHAALRTSFHWEGLEKPVQVVYRQIPVTLVQRSWRRLSQAEQQERLAEYLRADRERGFDLELAPLMRLALFELGEGAWQFVWSFHHLYLDGWSNNLVLREVLRCYEAFSKGREVRLAPTRPYEHYVAWIGEQDLEQAKRYWQTLLAGFTAPVPLARWQDPLPDEHDDYREIELTVSTETSSALRELAQQHRLTLNTLVQGAWGLLVSRYTGASDVVFGNTSSGRPGDLPGVESMVGLFINTLPVRVKVKPEETALPWLERFQDLLADLRQYEYTPLDMVQGWSEMPAGNPLFDNILVFENYPWDVARERDSQALRVSGLSTLERTNYPMTVAVTPGPQLTVKYLYDRHCFDDAAVRRMGRHYENLLRGLAADPSSRRLGEVPALAPAERWQLLAEWNDTARPYARDLPVHKLFELRAERTPDAVAVVCDRRLSYHELNRRANRLAHHLRALGVGRNAGPPEKLIAIYLERSPGAVVACLAALKAGGAYLPLDVAYPRERLSFMLEDAAAPVLITDDRRAAALPAGLTGVTVLRLDRDAAAIAGRSDRTPTPAVGPDHLAYVIYTSGSTGRPKGTELTHAGLANLVAWHRREYRVSSADRATQLASLGFDASVWEMWPYLTAGATLHIPGPEVVSDPPRLLGWLADEGITLAFLPTPLAEAVLAEPLPPHLRLRALLTGGDRLHRRPARELPFTLLNHYGPTENTVVTTWTAVAPGEHGGAPPIGRPIANTEVYVLDRALEPAPVGVAGELCAGGVGLARGYAGRAQLSAEKFVPHPFAARPGERLYRTGDLVRYLPEGGIEFLGRIDHQVKVRGFRVELGEIEAVLSRHRDVRESVVVRDEIAQGGGRGGPARLVAYVVADREPRPAVRELRESLNQELPEFMVPSAFVFPDALPLLPNGKVDRRALPAPEGIGLAPEDELVAPSSATEKLLAGIWEQVLGVEGVGVHDNFFELGGDSILGIRVVSRLREAGLRLSPRDLFQYQTVAELAAVASAAPRPGADQGTVTGELPLVPIQRWFFERELPEPHHFNQAVLLELAQAPEPQTLATALAALEEHHDALRLRFLREPAGWRQLNAAPSGALPLVLVDLSALQAERQPAAVTEVAARLQASLDLTRGPLWRAALFDLGPGRTGRLLWLVHHLVVDAVSWRVLLEDLERVYRQVEGGEAVALPPKTESFKGWAERLAEYAGSQAAHQELAWWLAEPGARVSPLPADFAGGVNSVASARTVSVSLAADETRSLLREVPAAYHTRINEVLLAALLRAFTRWTGTTTLLVDLEGHGREELFDDVDVSCTVGWFTAIWPVLLERGRTSAPEADLIAVKERLRAVPNGGIGYGLLRYLSDEDTARRLRGRPRAEVSFNYLGQLDPVLSESAPWRPARESSGAAVGAGGMREHLVEINGGIAEGRLSLSWTYSENVHRRDTVEALAEGFIEALRALIRHCLSPGAGTCTPADFPEAGLRQKDLDKLLAQTERRDRSLEGLRIESVYPLSPLQQGILFHSLYAPGSGVYVVQWTVRLEGRLLPSLFQRAWQHVVDRHSALRTSFHWQELEKPVQVVYRRIPLALDHISWRRLSAAEQLARLADYLDADRARGFDVTVAPLMRLALFELDEDAWHFVWSFHHLYLDGWSNNLVINEVFRCYEAFSEGREVGLAPCRSYRQYVAWLMKQDPEQAKRYWQGLLAGFTAPVLLARSQDLSPGEHDDYREIELTVAAGTSSALGAPAQHRLTLNTLVQGAWGLLVSRYTGANDVVFGSTTSGRSADLPGVESMVGLFINTLPVRVKLTPEEAPLPWLERFQALLAELRDYEYTPLDRVQGWSEIAAGNALFDNILVFENYPWDTSRVRDSQTLEVSALASVERTNYPMTVAVAPGPQLMVHFLYDRRYFDELEVRRMGRHYENLLHGLAADPPYRRLGEVPMLAPAERWQLLVEWNDVARSYPRDATLHALFEVQAERRPEAVAVVFDRHLSYRELNRRANRLADHLGALGVGRSAGGPEELIAIYLERSPETVAACLAVLKAGGAYLPLDLSSPPDRLAFMLEDAAAPVLVTSEQLAGTLPAELAARGVRVVCLDRDAAAIARSSERNPQPPAAVGARNLAYVIYTSGSTGRPKGIGVSHRAVARLVVNTDYVALGPGDRVAQASTTSFDAATFELWGALVHGARLVGIPKDVAIAPPALAAALREQGITTLFLTTALFNQMAREDPGAFAGLRHLLFGGEAVDPGWVREVLGQFPGRLVHVYGPTESTTFTTWQRVREVPAGARTVPIGSPIANTEVCVLDRTLEPVPVGVAGELLAGGDGLARGYAGRPQLSAEKFVPHPFSTRPGERLYRTGDLVRYLPEGGIEFLGRIDHQVKLRGFRVELGEIKAVLNRHGGVRESVVVVRDEIVEGHGQLVAYVVAAAEPRPAVRELRQFLKQALPDYMVPAIFVFLDALPLTPNGKVDRRALPAPVAGEIAPQGELAAAGNPTEELLAGIWGEVLGVGGVGVHDDFFELGGHSLLATQLASRVRETFAVELELRKIFEAPTVAELAAIIDAAQLGKRGLEAPPMVARARDREFRDGVPLSFAQQRLWYLYQLEPSTPVYNLPAAVRLSGALSPAVLERIFNEVVRRHEALRTTFTTAVEQPVQLIAERLPLPLPVVDLERLPGSAREALAERLAGEEARRLFDLSSGPLVRFTLLHLADQDHVLLVTMHHIVSDGWSMGIFLRELSVLFEAFSQGNPSPLAELPLQYADFAHWQRQWLAGEVLEAEIAYWHVELAGAPRHLELPCDRPRPAVQTFGGRVQRIALSEELSAALVEVGRGLDVTLFMTLLAAFATLLGRHAGQEDVVVGSPIAGRNRREIEGLIGFFVNTLVLRTDLAGGPAHRGTADRNPSFEQLLARVRRTALDGYAHQNLPFEQLVEELRPQRDPSRHPLFQVMFALQNAPRGSFESSGLTLSPLEIAGTASRFDLTVSLQESVAGVTGVLEYNTDLFDAVTIERLAWHFRTLLAGVVADPQACLSDLPLLSSAETHQITREWNDARSDYPQGRAIHEHFERWAERTPEATAVVFADRYLSYRELDRRANQLAHHLRALGVGRGAEVLTGIYLERSAEAVVAILAVVKAGGAYLPLDLSSPPERLARMLENAGAPVLVSVEALAPALSAVIAERPVAVVYLDRDAAAIRGCAGGDPPPVGAAGADRLAYVIYTSGSTGRPKGVGITHRAIARLVFNTNYIAPQPGDRIAQASTISFDAATFELWGALAHGAQLRGITRDVALDPRAFSAALRDQAVTAIFLTTALFNQLAREDPQAFTGLDHLLFGGELVDPDAVRQVLEAGRFPGRLLHVYGPTESTTFTTWQRVREVASRARTVAIGAPLSNTDTYVLDRFLSPVPMGVAGELAIGGDGLARCYVRSPQQTAEKFIPHPLSDRGGERLYRTGDLVRRRPEGPIEFLGRLDHQVKVRGFRIELGEIEAVLSRHSAVREAVVLAREDTAQGRSLVAYVVWDSDDPLLAAAGPGQLVGELRRFLGEKLPEYMVPAAFVFLDAFPLTPTGKVDRRALPAPERSRPELEEAFVAPRTPVEQTLARIWSQVLSVDRVGAHDNFFYLGGDSILGIQVAVRAREAGLELSPKDLFEHQTLAELAAVTTTLPQLEGDQGTVSGELPLVPIQHWFFERELPQPHHFNQAVLLELQQTPDPQLLERSLAALERHHDALRLRFLRGEAGWRQRYAAPSDAVPLVRVDLSALPDKRQRAAVTEVAAELQASLDFGRGPLWRAALMERGPERSGRLFWVVHHLAVDGVSWRVLLEDLERVYRRAERGEKITLPPKATSFKSWAERLGEYARSEALRKETAYWLAEPRTRVSPLPEDVAGGVNTVASARTLTVALEVGETRSLLQEVPAAYHTRINDVLLAALLEAFARWTGEESLLVDLEGHGREELFEGVEVSRTVGWFTVICPVLLECGKARGPGEDLMAVKEQLRAVPNGGIGYGLLRYLRGDEELAPRLRRLPRAQVSFNYLGQLDPVFADSQLLRPAPESSAAPSDSGGMRSHLLHINGGVAEGRLSLTWIYSENVHHRATVERLAEGFLEALRALIRHCLSPEAGAYTPADFPEAKLGQKGLDKLFAQIKRKAEAELGGSAR